MSKGKARGVRWLLILLCTVGFYFLAESKTHGFRYYYLLSNLPNEPRWEVPPLTSEEMTRINALLQQPFTFLGSGGWCYAFLGEDKKTVIKFFKHSHLYPRNLLRDFSFEKLFLKSPPNNYLPYYFHPFNFTSCTFLYRELKEYSGIQYLHINKTENLHPHVTLYDNIGVRYTIDLDKTEFIVQERAELLFPHIENYVKKNDLAGAKQAIDAMLDCILTIYKKGARDVDTALRDNFGYIGNRPITIDLSSWIPDETMKSPARYKKEIIVKTLRLNRWLNKYHPELHLHLENRLIEIMEKG